ncbi:Cytochrome P450 family ent-kaurenoic acid oxidase [Melia azedarach]|uniref:Cytochrome P450 family ent-kaurenoic acid oxidase n=1 Tax=Melia azedarach TaxID=155640 RepID=A0ACC1YYB2_MELAZ|nr:Cytochrome P450 family ent-kaurenoic acid oxidase [Melia azedarach]
MHVQLTISGSKNNPDQHQEAMGLEVLLSILAVLVGSYIVLFGFLKRVNEWYHVMKLGEKKKTLPPGDMGWPIFGNMFSFLRAFRSSDPDTFISNIVEKYGKGGVYKTYLFGNPSVIVCTPETCRPALMDDERFALGYSTSMSRLAGRTFLNLPKSEHRGLRKLMTSPMIGHEALAMYMENIEDVAITSMEEWAKNDKPVEFFYETRKVSFKFIMRILLGSSGDSIIEPVEKHYNDLHHGFHSTAINIPGFPFYKALKARNTLVKILQKVVDERKAMQKSGQQPAKRGMIDLMMEAEFENGKKLEDEEIVDLIIILLLGAHDGPTHATMWVTVFLHQHPQMLQKAKEEQEEILKKRPSTQKGLNLKEIKQMEYLAKVIDETLRIMNLPFLDFRDVKADANIKGYTIPKGWKVLIWSRGVHMNPEYFSSPKEFNPSRWDNPVEAGSFIPFGGGSRRCLGIDVAKLEISIFVHHFLLNYKLEQLNPGSPIVYLPTTRPSDNCLARVTKLK